MEKARRKAAEGGEERVAEGGDGDVGRPVSSTCALPKGASAYCFQGVVEHGLPVWDGEVAARVAAQRGVGGGVGGGGGYGGQALAGNVDGGVGLQLRGDRRATARGKKGGQVPLGGRNRRGRR